MKRVIPLLISFLLILPFPLVFASASKPVGPNLSPDGTKIVTRHLMDEDDCVRGIQYTEAQKKTLDDAYDKLYKDYEHLFQTYVSFGAMEKNQKDRHLSMLKAYIERIKKHQYRWCNDDDEWDEDDRWSEDSWKMDDRGEKGEIKEKPEMEKINEGKMKELKKEKKEGKEESNDNNGKWKKKWKKDDDHWEKDDDRWERDDKGERDDDRWEKEDDKWDRD